MTRPDPHIPLSVEDCLRLEAESVVKHEYVAGEVYALSGASERQNRIAGNAHFHLRAAARGGSCGTDISDMKLRVAGQDAFYYPDVMLCCDPADDHPQYKTSPCILVEVLSPSTANIDRREKWLAYRSLQGLRACLLVEADRRLVDDSLRGAEGGWQIGRLEEGEVLNLDCGVLALALTLDDLNEDVALP